MSCKYFGEVDAEDFDEDYNLVYSIFLDLLTVFLISLILSFIFPLLNNDIDGLLNDRYCEAKEEQYVHLMRLADYFQEAFIWTSFLIALQTFMILNALRIFRIIHWTILIFERSLKIFLYFCLFLCPLLIGFAFVFNMFFGPYLVEY